MNISQKLVKLIDLNNGLSEHPTGLYLESITQAADAVRQLLAQGDVADIKLSVVDRTTDSRKLCIVLQVSTTDRREVTVRSQGDILIKGEKPNPLWGDKLEVHCYDNI